MSTFDPNQAQNLPEIEKQIAVRCVEHAQTYWSLLQKVRGSALRLTKYVYFFLTSDWITTFTQTSSRRSLNLLHQMMRSERLTRTQ